MIIWGSVLVPVITVVILLLFFKHQTVWWEFFIPVVVSLMLIGLCKSCSEGVQTRDTEYLGGYGVKAIYYEAWNERVPCSHPKYCTRTVTRTGSDGRTYTSTESYQCGHHHLYDVDNHPPRWVLDDSNRGRHRISKSYFDSLTSRWKNKVFKDLNRSYHTRDGDSYVTAWDNNDDTLEPVVTTNTYKNRVQASDSVFSYQEVDPKMYGLFEYPEVNGYRCDSVLGVLENKATASRYLNIWNAKLGRAKQVRMWMLIYVNQPMAAALEQESYWKGGNKNEVVVCIGVDKNSSLKWCHVFSWTEVESMKVRIRSEISSMEVLDVQKAAEVLVSNVQKDFRRKEFADFDYLTVEPPIKYVIMTFVLTVLVNVGLSVFVIKNNIKEKAKRR